MILEYDLHVQCKLKSIDYSSYLEKSSLPLFTLMVQKLKQLTNYLKEIEKIKITRCTDTSRKNPTFSSTILKFCIDK